MTIWRYIYCDCWVWPWDFLRTAMSGRGERVLSWPAASVDMLTSAGPDTEQGDDQAMASMIVCMIILLILFIFFCLLPVLRLIKKRWNHWNQVRRAIILLLMTMMMVVVMLVMLAGWEWPEVVRRPFPVLCEGVLQQARLSSLYRGGSSSFLQSDIPQLW